MASTANRPTAGTFAADFLLVLLLVLLLLPCLFLLALALLLPLLLPPLPLIFFAAPGVLDLPPPEESDALRGVEVVVDGGAAIIIANGFGASRAK